MSGGTQFVVKFGHVVSLIIAILIAFGGLAYGYGALNKQTENNTVAINALTRAINCHMSGGADKDCYVQSSLSMK